MIDKTAAGRHQRPLEKVAKVKSARWFPSSYARGALSLGLVLFAACSDDVRIGSDLRSESVNDAGSSGNPLASSTGIGGGSPTTGSAGGTEGNECACPPPPSPTCMTETTLRTYERSCATGICSYLPMDNECPAGCGGDACYPKVLRVSTGGANCAILVGGALKCWGSNSFGQLGNGVIAEDSIAPVDVIGLSSGVTAISLSGSTTCALTSAGAVRCWGDNSLGELGDGSTTNSSVPVDVIGLSSGVTAISHVGPASDTFCALTSGGVVQCWGYNANGELGGGSTTNSSIPVDVLGLSPDIVALSENTLCAFTEAGAIQCWGPPLPEAVTNPASDVIAVSGNSTFGCSLTSGGAVACWGSNNHGQLGNGGNTDSPVPLAVSGLSSGAVAISVGFDVACAINSAGGVQCWGDNQSGLLGNGSTVDSNVPVDVTGLSSDVANISVSGFACVVTSGGAVKCWGGVGEYGAIGVFAFGSSTPVDVLGL